MQQQERAIQRTVTLEAKKDELLENDPLTPNSSVLCEQPV